MNKSSWGGYRPGSGQKPKWKSGETKPLRIPVKLHEQVIAFAQLLDLGKDAEELLSCDIAPIFDRVTQSKLDNVTLSNDSVTQPSFDNLTVSSQLGKLIVGWKKRANRSANPKWYHAKKLLGELDQLTR